MDDLQGFFDSILPLNLPVPTALEIVLAMGLSFTLMVIIATTYKQTYRGTLYSQDHVHTLIILGVVVSVIIMVVRGSTSVAFGMFAAFSIIRFRSNVPQSRDVGFIFFSMATGMAVGARQYTLAVLTVILVCVLIYLITRYDLFAPVRASHYLRVRVTNDIDYDHAFNACYAEHTDRCDLLSVETIQAGMMTELRYGVRLRAGATPGALVSALQQINGNNRVLLTTASPDTSASTD